MLYTHAGQVKGYLGRHLAAQQLIGCRVGRGRVAHHLEAAECWGECLCLLMDRDARPPPPGAVYEGSVCRVHQTDDRVVDMAGEGHGEGGVGSAVTDIRYLWRIDHLVRFVAEIDPDIALHLAAGIATHPDPLDIELLSFEQGWNRGTAPLSIEASAVIAALDLAAIEGAGRQRNTTMRADVAQGEGVTVGVAGDQDRFAQQCLRDHRPPFQQVAPLREIP